MINITARLAATDTERLKIDEEAGDLPDGVRAFDGTDWDYVFFCGLDAGDWVVEIEDPDNQLRWQVPGLFLVQVGEDGGFLRRLLPTDSESWSALRRSHKGA